jgi:protocatechuate 3,4-dioxygenase beta subunit
MTEPNVFTRGAVLRAGGAGLVAAALGVELSAATDANASLAAACTLTPEQEEGPYYVDLERIRNDVREAKAGLPLHLAVTIVDSTTCKPIPNAAVDIWHCDALGEYSGVNGTTTTFLRGVQLTDAKGVAHFATIYPGWYQGRATHIHMKVHIGGKASGTTYSGGHVSHTGQMFFPDAISDTVAKRAPYSARTGTRTRNAEDRPYTEQGGSKAVLKLALLKKGAPAKGYTGSVVLGVNPTATPAAVG